MKRAFRNQYLWIPFTLLIMCFSFWMISQFFFDNDGWFILTNGRYILNHGIPKKNPFTFLQDLDIIIQQWLWSVLLYWGYSKVGSWWIAAVVVFMYLLTLYLFIRISQLHGLSYKKTLPFGVCCLLLMSGYLNMRPTFITVILLLWQVFLLEKYKTESKRIKLLWLIVISLLEINFHAAIWVLHFVFMFPYLIPEISNPWISFKKQSYSRKPLYIIILPMIVAGFFNPYGIKGILYLSYSYGEELKSAGIIELMAPATNNFGIIIFVLMILCAVWSWHNRKNFIPSSFFYILCGTGILSLFHIRNGIYFLLGFMLYGIYIMKTFRIHAKKLNQYSMVMVCAAVLLLGICISSSAVDNIKRSPEVKDSSTTPIVAINYLVDNQIPKGSRIYTSFNCGGFLEWNGYKAFMDPRPELYFKTLNGKIDAFADYNKCKKTYTADELKAFINKYDFEWMIVNDTEPLHLYLDLSENNVEVANGNGYRVYKIL